MVDVTGKGGIDILRQDKILKVLEQTGERKSVPRDRGRFAKLPGKRVSKAGNVYWETRKNRSDKRLSAI